MGMTPTAAPTRSPATGPAAQAVGVPRLLAVLPVLAVLVVAALLSACGQGSTGPGAAGPGVVSTTLPPPTTGDGMDETTAADPSTPPSGAPTGDLPLLPLPSGVPGPALPSDPAGADLVLVAGPPGAQQPPVTLVCDWAGGTISGTHPQALQACADLRAALQAGDPFAPVAPDAMCTQQYGGDAVVEVSGAVLGADGSPVDVAATFTLTDGCQISRFQAMGAVLAPFRGTV